MQLLKVNCLLKLKSVSEIKNEKIHFHSFVSNFIYITAKFKRN